MNINDLKDCIQPVDYYDFPESLIAFSRSLINSDLAVSDRSVFFRKRNKQLTLITYTCDSQKLLDVINRLKGKEFKVKSLNYVNKDMEAFDKISYGKEYYVKAGFEFNFSHVNSRKRTKAKNRLKRCEAIYSDVSNDFTFKEFQGVFDYWLKDAAARHFMVIKGHYLQYAHRFFSDPNSEIRMIGFRDSDGNLYGVAGYEVFKNCAQITLMKHRIGDNNFSTFFWVKIIEHILKYDNVEKVFCGTTADVLKQKLGMPFDKSYKLKV